MEMDIALKIVALSALITFMLLAVFAMISLVSAVKSMREVNTTINNLSKDLGKSIEDISNNLENIKTKLSESLDSFDITAKQITATSKALEEGTKGISGTISLYSNLFNKIHSKIANPISDVAVYISAAAKAFTTFSKIMTRSK
ncbi:hypothetical protein ACFLSQ_08100 [Bacteroidota bacterium]